MAMPCVTCRCLAMSLMLVISRASIASEVSEVSLRSWHGDKVTSHVVNFVCYMTLCQELLFLLLLTARGGGWILCAGMIN